MSVLVNYVWYFLSVTLPEKMLNFLPGDSLDVKEVVMGSSEYAITV